MALSVVTIVQCCNVHRSAEVFSSVLGLPSFKWHHAVFISQSFMCPMSFLAHEVMIMTHTVVRVRWAYKQTCFYSCTQTFFPISCVFAVSWSTMAGRHLTFNSPSTPLHGRDQPLSASPQTGEKKLLNAISGLSHQLTLFAADVNEQVTVVNSRLLSIEDRLAALESKNCVKETNSKKRRRVHNPKIAVRMCSVTAS